MSRVICVTILAHSAQLLPQCPDERPAAAREPFCSWGSRLCREQRICRSRYTFPQRRREHCERFPTKTLAPSPNWTESEVDLKAVADRTREDGCVYPLWTGIVAEAERRLELIDRYRTGRGKWIALVEALDWDPHKNLEALGSSRSQNMTPIQPQWLRRENSSSTMRTNSAKARGSRLILSRSWMTSSGSRRRSKSINLRVLSAIGPMTVRIIWLATH